MSVMFGTTVNLLLSDTLGTGTLGVSRTPRVPYNKNITKGNQMTNSPLFVAISFGPNGNEFWNQITYHSTQRAAERWGLEQMPIAGVFGYVVIESKKNSWRVVDEIGAPNVSITQVSSFFSVQPAPRLQLV